MAKMKVNFEDEKGTIEHDHGKSISKEKKRKRADSTEIQVTRTKKRSQTKQQVVLFDGRESTFETCFTPQSTIDLTLTYEQRKDVKALGFESLLDMKIEKLPVCMIPYLVANFELIPRIQSIGQRRYQLTPDDVYEIFCLPKNRNKGVCVVKDDDLRNQFVEKYGTDKDDPMHVANLVHCMGELKKGGDKFKRMFMLYCVGSCLTSFVMKTVDFSLLKALEDVFEIKNLDWCSFVLDRLSQAQNQKGRYKFT